MQQITLTFNADAVAAPAQLAAREANEVVAFSLLSIATGDLTNPPEPNVPGKMHYLIKAPDRTAEERKAAYTNWILAKGIHELARGIRVTLEEAFLFVEGLKIGSGQMTFGKLNELIAAIRERANKRNFPDLITDVNKELKEPLSFLGEFMSLQKVRNCLEHRAGLVGAADVDDTQTLILNLPRIKAYVIQNDQEIEIVPPFHVEADTMIHFKRVTRTRTYSLGERVTIDAADFNEMAFACSLFASDLASKLPVTQGPTYV